MLNIDYAESTVSQPHILIDPKAAIVRTTVKQHVTH